MCCKVKHNTRPLIVITVYRSPSDSFNDFLINPDSILNMLCSSKTEFVICRYININYLDSCVNRQQLDALFQTYNLMGTVLFPTHKSSTSAAAIDNIFTTQTKSYTIHPHCNGLSDHEAQIIVTESTVPSKHRNHILTIRDFNDLNILEFQSLLSQENWEEILMDDDANISFNKFLNTYIRIFDSCFVKKHKNFAQSLNPG